MNSRTDAIGVNTRDVPAGGKARDASSVVAMRPSAALAPYVDHYWLCAHGRAPVTTLLPDGRVDVVFERTARRLTASVCGSVTARTEIPVDPRATYIGIQFRPGRARHFVSAPAHELTDRMLPADSALALALDCAQERADPFGAVAALDAALRRHLARVPPSDARIDRLVAAVEAAHGNLRVAALAERFAVSRRQIEREFMADVGLTPKAFAAILRFNFAARQLRAAYAPSDVAIAAGYADQSHLNQAFRRYADLTPSLYERGDVAFLQDSKVWLPDDGALRNFGDASP